MDANFPAGVIEGFYGQPWSQAERFELFDWMKDWGLNTYLYAPKDDLKHRALWRELYSSSELNSLRQLIQRCRERNVQFIYGISPGLDIQYGNKAELGHLNQRLDQMREIGCQSFAVLFDDLAASADAALALAQAEVANAVRRGRFLFCPTAYCGRMAASKEEYLATLGHELSPDIDVFWTGPEIISREITVSHIRELQSLLHRKPLIWDNLHANDYDGRRFYCGPYAGRPPELRAEVSGLLMNPNNEFPVNYVPLRTFAEFVRSKVAWDLRKAYLAAMAEWLPRFATVGEPLKLEDLILFGDCYYLPHVEGPEAEALLRGGAVQACRLRDFCARLAELRDRSLFYALHRRAWELREELDLLIRYFQSETTPFHSDSHLPGTFRGGMVARLQRLLKQHADGTFTP
jgi:protein O-GlcNAcase/histone acetyltransferase